MIQSEPHRLAPSLRSLKMRLSNISNHSRWPAGPCGFHFHVFLSWLCLEFSHPNEFALKTTNSFFHSWDSLASNNQRQSSFPPLPHPLTLISCNIHQGLPLNALSVYTWHPCVCLLCVSACQRPWLTAGQVRVKDFDSYIYVSRERVYTIY